VQIVSNVTPEGLTFKVPVQPALFVTVSPQTIHGWGLETAEVLVQARGLERDARREVQISNDRPGRLAASTLTLGASGQGAVSIRSAATGVVKITASGPGFQDGHGVVTFAPPTLFIAAGVVGGLAGGLLRVGGRWRGRIPRAVGQIALALLCGAVVLGLYALGVNVTGFTLPGSVGEVAVFVVSALGAFGGTSRLNPASR
jgi:hypothetical protein